MKNLDLSIFPKIDRDQWLQLAEKQLKGADPNEKLTWENSANLKLNGYYDQSDISELDYLKNFFLGLESHPWKLYERIETSNPKLANGNALKALMGGCDGIILDQPDESKLDVILQEVNADICDISIVGNQAYDRSKFSGFHLTENGNCAETNSYNPVEQLHQLLTDLSGKTHVHRIAVADFFLEIATVRALRFLIEDKSSGSIHIHTHVPLHLSEEHQWFLNTTAGLASILGGSHSIDLSTATGDARISRNTGHLIREESGITKYSDQCGGSYYIEVLTDKIIKKVSEKLK